MKALQEPSVLVRARVPARRLRNAEHILAKMGLKTSDAINILMAQVELRQGLPFDMFLGDQATLSADVQAGEWTEALGEY
jgi:addiction module RelB/DinJ family antitoxin